MKPTFDHTKNHKFNKIAMLIMAALCLFQYDSKAQKVKRQILNENKVKEIHQTQMNGENDSMDGYNITYLNDYGLEYKLISININKDTVFYSLSHYDSLQRLIHVKYFGLDSIKDVWYQYPHKGSGLVYVSYNNKKGKNKIVSQVKGRWSKTLYFKDNKLYRTTKSKKKNGIWLYKSKKTGDPYWVKTKVWLNTNGLAYKSIRTEKNNYRIVKNNTWSIKQRYKIYRIKRSFLITYEYDDKGLLRKEFHHSIPEFSGESYTYMKYPSFYYLYEYK